MATVTVTPLEHRAKWAQRVTEHDAPNAAPPAPIAPQKRHARRVIVEFEVDRTATLDSILNAIDNRDGAKILRVVE